MATFVDSAPLFALLSTENNQVIYGRRGTGKTHALKVLADHVEQQKNGIPVFIDMRTVGSNGSIYADTTKPLAERASTLLRDALSILLIEFQSIASGAMTTHPNPNELTRLLEVLQTSISTIKIVGDLEEEMNTSNKEQSSASAKASINLAKSPSIGSEISRTVGESKAGDGQSSGPGAKPYSLHLARLLALWLIWSRY